MGWGPILRGPAPAGPAAETPRSWVLTAVARSLPRLGGFEAVVISRIVHAQPLADPAERKKKYDEMVAQMYERGKAISAATLFEFDEVIDPAETRKWITAGLRSVPPSPKREGKKLKWIDAW